LLAPIERQTRIGHQLLGGEFGRLFAGQDRSDDVGGEKGQPQETSRIGWNHLLSAGDVVESRTGALTEMLADEMSSSEKSDEASIGDGGVSIALDDELHLLSRSFQLRPNRERRHLLFIAVGGKQRRRFWDTVTRAGHKMFHHSRRIQIDVDAIRMDLHAGEARAQGMAQRFGRLVVRAVQKRCCRLSQPFLGGGVVLALRNRIQQRSWVSDKGPNALDDEVFWSRRRDPLASGIAGRRPRDKMARHIVAISSSFLHGMARCHGAADDNAPTGVGSLRLPLPRGCLERHYHLQ
jgi:hypothetical protein